jgi:AraC-like DNA-binding protein
MPEDPGVLPSVRKAVAESMRDGDPNLARVAKKMAMSRRTLQRQIKEHATNFRKVMDDTRRRFALSYLKDRRNTLSEIAFLLGYSEAAAFTRAFKRWTGLTPVAYRRRLRRQPPTRNRFRPIHSRISAAESSVCGLTLIERACFVRTR